MDTGFTSEKDESWGDFARRNNEARLNSAVMEVREALAEQGVVLEGAEGWLIRDLVRKTGLNQDASYTGLRSYHPNIALRAYMVQFERHKELCE